MIVSRLYKYARSNEKSGYYIIGDNGNATFQCRPIVERLFETLDYDPPVKTKGQGPQIPSKLHWHLFDLEWLYTGENTAPPVAPGELPDKTESGQSLTDEVVEQIQEFAHKVGGKEAQELADRFDFATPSKEPNPNRLTDVDSADLAVMEASLFHYLSTALPDAAGGPVDALNVYVGRIKPHIIFNISIRLEDDEPSFTHLLFVTIRDGTTEIQSQTNASHTLETESRIDIHRGHVFAGLNQIGNELLPNANLEGPAEHSASYEADIYYHNELYEI